MDQTTRSRRNIRDSDGRQTWFSIFAGRRVALIRELTLNMNFVELDAGETLAALDVAQQRGVRGGRVHDWLHARAAQKAKVDELLTDNLNDFAGLDDGFSSMAP